MSQQPSENLPLVVHGKAGSEADPQDETMRRRRMKLLALLRGRLHWAIILGVILAVLGGVAGYYSQGDRYRSIGKIQINPQLPDPGLYRSFDGGVPPMFNDYINTQIDRLKSPEVLQVAANSPQVRAVTPDGFSGEDLASEVRVDQGRSGLILDVSVESPDRDFASAATGAVISAYMDAFQANSDRELSKMLELLAKRRSELTNQIDNLKRRRGALAGSLGYEGLVQRQEATLTKLSRYEEALDQLQVQIGGDGTGQDKQSYKDMSVAEMAYRFPQMDALFDRKDDLTSQIQSLRAQGYLSRHNNVRRLQSQVDLVDQQIDKLASDIRAGLVVPGQGGSGSEGGANNIQAMQMQAEQLKQKLAEARAESSDLGQRRQQIENINEQVARSEQQLAQTKDRLEQASVQRTAQTQITGRVERMGKVYTPTDPSNGSERVRMAMLGSFGGGVCGVGLIMALGIMDRRLRHAADAEAGLASARMLGILPTLPKDLSDPDQAEKASHAVHHIRTLLQLSSGEMRRESIEIEKTHAMVYAITSPAAGSGKSSLSMALALSFAASDSRTLLIDCDVVGAGVTSRMGTKVHKSVATLLRESGLMDLEQIEEAMEFAAIDRQPIEEVIIEQGYISQEELDRVLHNRQEKLAGLLDACEQQNLEGCVADSGIENLHVLPVGNAQPRDAGSLSPVALHKLLTQARERYDVVLIDTGPILGSLEASMVVTEANSTILVVSRGDEKAPAYRSLELIQGLGARVAGVVFNHATHIDVQRSSYASMVSASRSDAHHVPVRPLEHAERFGPLGSAVASYGAVPKPTLSPASNGHAITTTNGHHGYQPG